MRHYTSLDLSAKRPESKDSTRLNQPDCAQNQHGQGHKSTENECSSRMHLQGPNARGSKCGQSKQAGDSLDDQPQVQGLIALNQFNPLPTDHLHFLQRAQQRSRPH